MNEESKNCGLDSADQGVPTCSTGPFGRLTWTLRELASLFRGSDPHSDEGSMKNAR